MVHCLYKTDYVNQLTAEGYFLNTPPVRTGNAPEELRGRSLFTVDSDHVAIDWVKLSEDGKGVIVRAYEFAGSPAEAAIKPANPLGLRKAYICDLMENETAEAGEKTAFGPYEIITLKYRIHK